MANKLVTVAGVQFTDTTLCNAAVDLLAETSPKFLYNHCIRAYVFGILAVEAMGNCVGLPWPCCRSEIISLPTKQKAVTSSQFATMLPDSRRRDRQLEV